MSQVFRFPSFLTIFDIFMKYCDEHCLLSIVRELDNEIRGERIDIDVIGAVIPTRINGKDANVDGLEDTALTWNNLVGYYRMNVSCGDLAPYKGVSGRLRNITTSQQKTAPLPYTSRANGTWTVDNTWTNFP